MALEVYSIEGPAAVEFYVTATPSRAGSASDQGRELFGGVRDVLRDTQARILDEQVFATAGAMGVLPGLRQEAYGDCDDGVAPTCLIVEQGASSDPVKGIRVHAVRSAHEMAVLEVDGLKCGRVLQGVGHAFVTCCGLTAPECGPATAQVRAVLDKADAMLRQIGGGIRSVVRTWFWLDEILSWYDDFNRVRTDFCRAHGLIDAGSGRSRLPASTGIGISPGGGAKCALTLAAVVEPSEAAEFVLAGGEQGSPYAYGSAFSRAARALLPAGETVFVSGTAAVDIHGRTEHVGLTGSQINATIANVQAILKDMSCSDEDVVQAVAYCKSSEVENAFSTISGRVPWPFVTVLADICRDDLLFEVEVTAKGHSNWREGTRSGRVVVRR